MFHFSINYYRFSKESKKISWIASLKLDENIPQKREINNINLVK